VIEKTFDKRSGNINYVESSTGGMPLLLLHGMASMWQSYTFLFPHFEKDFHVYAMDLRGHGKSSRANSYKIEEFVPDTASFIKNCIKEPTIIFGHSYGGIIGIMTAAQHPEPHRVLAEMNQQG
jgi:pimeloyl-ACP methyl ester carboxylesterase